MKKFLFVLLVIAACNKPGGPDKNQTKIHIKESKTSASIQGVTVRVFKCDFGCPFGGKKLFDGPTDAEGNVYMDPDDFSKASGGMSLEKPQYWSTAYLPVQTTASIIPEGWLRIRIVRTGSYPASARLKFVVQSEAIEPKMLDIWEFNIAADSSILIRGYGTQLNKLDWQVSDMAAVYASGTLNQQVPKFDTVKNITLNY